MKRILLLAAVAGALLAQPKGMPDGAKLEFEVATIKPTQAGRPGNGGFAEIPNGLRSPAITLADFMTFAYQLHASQIAGLPGWAQNDRWEIVAQYLQGAEPTDPQLFKMLQNLIESRFGVSFHKEKRELPVYAITIGGGGAAGVKMTTNNSRGPRVTNQGLGNVRLEGTTMFNLANMLQQRVFDRPVIDQSGLTDHYDFKLEWTPDEFQFPKIPAGQRPGPQVGPNAPPDIFTAFQEQLGMKLESTKAPLEVLVLDKVSRPSEN